ncbi:hypothetical protein PHYC_02852 [Phycisphaerales bacterium]|nr:hypothetical protein PHYC_02852 [Phycisphaerales bacterium]
MTQHCTGVQESVIPVSNHPADGMSRRTLLSGLALLGAAGTRARAVPPQAPAEVDPSSLLNKLVRRTTMGLNEYELSQVRSRGYNGYLDYQLNPAAINDSALDVRLQSYSTLTMNYQQLLGVPVELVRNQCVEAAILRAVFSRKQLLERMVEFWTDHFNVTMNDRTIRLKSIEDRTLIRQHALGSFRDLLFGSATSPAMLAYLNNDLNMAGNPNENYARELMELHTLGVGGGYSQQDVIEVARCFTGWHVYPDSAGSLAGTFQFNAALHDPNQKVVLGQTIPARQGQTGIQDGYDVLNILLFHPNTARFIAKKLCRWLLGYEVPQNVEARVAAVFTATGGGISQMIREALRPDHLAAAPPKFKRTWHHFMSFLRAMPVNITSTMIISWSLKAAGMGRFEWPTPDGYPDNLEHWFGLPIARWNFAADVMNMGDPGVVPDVGTFFAGLTTADQIADRIDAAVFGGEWPRHERDRLRDFAGSYASFPSRQREVMGLVMASPSFQWY